MGWATSLDCWEADLIPMHQWVKGLVLPQVWLRSQLLLRSDPWPMNSICCGAANKGKKKKLINYSQEKKWREDTNYPYEDWKRLVARDPRATEGINRGSYQYLYVHEFNNLDDTGQLLARCKLPMLTHI